MNRSDERLVQDMLFATSLDLLQFTAVLVSIGALVYSVFSLFFLRRRLERDETLSSLAVRSVSRRNIALRTLAAADPGVRNVLSLQPEHVMLEVHATGPKRKKYEALIYVDGKRDQAAVLDLNKRSDLVALVEGLQNRGFVAQGGRKCRKKNQPSLPQKERKPPPMTIPQRLTNPQPSQPS